MKLDLLPQQEACDKLREAAEKELLSEEFRQALFTFLEKIKETFATLQELLVRPTSKNSHLPPSKDLTRGATQHEKSSRKPGGQTGHPGNTLEPFANPDKIVDLEPENIPAGFRKVAYERRQKVDIVITRCVTEYRAYIYENDEGRRLYASFPEDVKRLVQYGDTVKMEVAYQSAGQLIPFNRIRESLEERAGIPISEGTIHNFLLEAHRRLEGFERWNCFQLLRSPVNHFDETGCRIGGKRLWLHSASNGELTLYMPHEKRGAQGMEVMGLLPLYQGIAVHDFWAPYRGYPCTHAVCNVHVLRELEGCRERDGSQWPVRMQDLLRRLNKSRNDGELTEEKVQAALREYDDILSAGDKECPQPPPRKGKKGRPARGKSRCLLDRLRKYKEEVLLFLTHPEVPFSNNQAERDIRVSKVKQKISGCFRSMDGARIFCRVRSYISTCRKHGLSAHEALGALYSGKLPEFIDLESVPNDFQIGRLPNELSPKGQAEQLEQMSEAE